MFIISNIYVPFHSRSTIRQKGRALVCVPNAFVTSCRSDIARRAVLRALSTRIHTQSNTLTSRVQVVCWLCGACPHRSRSHTHTQTQSHIQSRIIQVACKHRFFQPVSLRWALEYMGAPKIGPRTYAENKRTRTNIHIHTHSQRVHGTRRQTYAIYILIEKFTGRDSAVTERSVHFFRRSHLCTLRLHKWFSKI